MDILTIGAGVSGLTSGIALARAGHQVQIWAREQTPGTTSDVAAALWYPYLVEPMDHATAWGKVAYDHFVVDAASPTRGVVIRPVLEVFATSPSETDPPWASGVAEFRRARPDEVPTGYVAGYCFAAPVIDMAVYLPYLARTFLDLGGTIAVHAVQDLTEALAVADLVVDCAGLGARELVGDRDLTPVRGQVVRIRSTGDPRVFLADDGPHGLVYVVPRVNDVILGGVNAVGDERSEVIADQTASIIARCQAAVPWLGTIAPEDILGVAVGLRPARSSGVRLERVEIVPGRMVIHNYGHGGAGVTLSWGCAAAVVALAGKQRG